MRILTLLLFGLLALLQYRLWWGKHGIIEYRQREKQVNAQVAENERLSQRNKRLYADIDDLRIGLEAVEERARNELGMIRPGETFYRILQPQSGNITSDDRQSH